MLKNPFSFNGRIRRREYIFSLMLFAAALGLGSILLKLAGLEGDAKEIVNVLSLLVLLWFLFAQGAKRCHDFGKDAGCQFIPIYNFALLLNEGDTGPNQFGNDPKQLVFSEQEVIYSEVEEVPYQPDPELQALNDLLVAEGHHSFNIRSLIGQQSDDAMCLELKHYGMWEVFYTERGKDADAIFASQSKEEAMDFFYKYISEHSRQ